MAKRYSCFDDLWEFGTGCNVVGSVKKGLLEKLSQSRVFGVLPLDNACMGLRQYVGLASREALYAQNLEKTVL